MRGDKRVAVRFNLAARKASDEAKHEQYVQKYEASDNLKWTLSGDTVAENQAPLGKAPAGNLGHWRANRAALIRLPAAPSKQA